MGEECLKVFVAYDNRNNGNVERGEGHFRREIGGHNANNEGNFKGEGHTYNRDNQRFVDVVNGKHNRDGVKRFKKETNRTKVQPNSKEGFTLLREEKGPRRVTEVEENNVNNSILTRRVVGEEVTKKRGGVEKINRLWDGNNMEVDDKEERDEGDSNSEGGEFSDEENDDGKKMGCDNGSEPVMDSGGQNIREDEASRDSRESKVGDTFIGENVSSKNLVAKEYKRLRGKKRLMYACNTNEKNCFGPALETRIIKGVGLVSPLNDSLKERIKINPMTIKTFREGKRSQQVASAGVKFGEEMNVEGDLECRREKREISPSSLVVSEGDMLRKKKKANEEEMFEGKVDEMNFNQWKLDEKKYGGKKKNDRRSVTKAIKMARKIKVKGLGENKKEAKEDEGNSTRCNLNIEQVKEIEEMIGVSWVRVVEEESGRSKLDEPDFLRVVEGARMKEVRGFQPDSRFRDMLKKVKESLRVWSKDRYLIVSFKVFSIWKAFGENTCDLGSFEEEKDETTDLHQHFSRVCSQSLETASQDTRDVVTIHPTTTSQEITMALARTTQPKI
nr:RNA-directed DNA polymerase, eukaryota, reverse transcriptase zinc-binding domain protein [Tanacetum cinerariifolium]